ncbi:DHA2 family efflux MFS transporter permease subunit [Pseudonocardia sp. CA-107938]|uniref:DHA2 family efflux MFS transporter permease subunit n=1 Tax=Pseudonocardia sp. CA-107938 TaxID=3240021 RepID=UPI003D90C4F3
MVDGSVSDAERSPWPALWALVIGFFMILVDVTIVSIATPAIMGDLHADVDSVVWVTSGYLLSYAVPLLITGRMGDRYGPRRVYLVGLAIFTLASLWCGLTGSIGGLIAARVVQGLGASLMTPQTMAVINRTFPVESRGGAMSLWGATAGVATLVGPLLGGLLVDAFGWEWIFFVNVPVGVIGLVAAWRLVPDLPTHVHRFDWVGVALSAVGMFLLVFGIQEGQAFQWNGAIWAMIAAGVVVMGGFLFWQRRSPEPLISLDLFRDRNFSLSNVAITTVGFGITAMAFPLTFFAQGVLGLSPTGAALLTAPMSIVSGLLAPVVGRLIDRVHPRWIAGSGMLAMPVSLFWLSAIMGPDTPIWEVVLPTILLGVASAFVWAPLATTATRNLPPRYAGAGAGVYNTTRQIGSVLGSAAIAVLIASQLAANLPGVSGGGAETGVAHLPVALHAGFATAMSHAVLLPAAVLLIGFAAAAAFQLPTALARRSSQQVDAGVA